MAITLGGHSGGYGDGVTSQATGSLGTVASGSAVAVSVTYLQNTSETISSVVDSTGSNTYTLCSGTSANGNGEFIAIYRASNVTGGAAFTVTANFTGSAGEVSVFAVEIVGADTTDAFDVGAAAYQAAPGTGTDAVSSGATSTPSAAGGFVFGAMSRQSGIVDTLSAGTGFTILDRTLAYHAASEYFIQGAAAAATATFTQDFAGDTVCAVAVFKAAAASGTTLYFLDSAASGSNFGSLQVAGSAPSTATTATGWTVDTVAAGNYALMTYGSERASSNFGSTALPNAAPNNTTADCFRTTSTLSGDFATGVWTIAVPVIAVSAAAGQDGRVRVRLWRSTSATGASATEITSGAVAGTTVTNLTTGAEQVSTVTTSSITGFSMTAEYLFVQIAWEITGAAV